MIQPRYSNERGQTRLDWLDSRHTFSFDQYHDPAYMGFRHLRVINEDRVKPGAGFGTHAHRNMEIITYVLEGGLRHQDSMGNTSVIQPGELQRMSAGTGVQHSEFNESASDPVHFLQIWLLPEERSLKPEYEQKQFDLPAAGHGLRLVASRDARDGSLGIHQATDLWAGKLAGGQEVEQPIAVDHYGWLQVARGEVTLNGTPLAAGDGAAIRNESALKIAAKSPSEVLLFDMV